MQNFVGIFCVEIFLWTGATTRIYYYNSLYTLQKGVKKMEDYARNLCKSVYAAFTCIATSLRQLLGKYFAVKKN